MNLHFAKSVMFKRASWVRAAKMRNIYVGSVEDNSDIISQDIDDEVRYLHLTNWHSLCAYQTRPSKNIELCNSEHTRRGPRTHTRKIPTDFLFDYQIGRAHV